jgi:hypothetical protein
MENNIFCDCSNKKQKTKGKTKLTIFEKAVFQGILKKGSITVPLTSCLTGLESAV